MTLLPSSFPLPKSAPSFSHPSRKELYRSYLQHLRLIPDPHIWSVLIPRFRKLIRYTDTATNTNTNDDGSLTALKRKREGPHAHAHAHAHASAHAESSKAAEARAKVRAWRQEKALKQAQKELRRLRAAVASHPHALARLLEETYGQRGVTRWDLLRTISSPYSVDPPSGSLPPPLHPLRPPAKAPKESQPRARKYVPASTIRKEAGRAIERDWAMIKPPIVLPVQPTRQLAPRISFDPTASQRGNSASKTEDNPPGKGDGNGNGNGNGVIHNLRLLAGLDIPHNSNFDPGSSTSEIFTITQQPLALQLIRKSLNLDPLSNLPLQISLVFPHKLSPTLREPPLLPPRPKAVRQNPTTWSLPRRLDVRLLRRCYKRLWDGLVWVRPVTLPPSDLALNGSSSVAGGDRPEERWKKCSYEEMKAYERGELDDGDAANASSRPGESSKEKGKGKIRDKPSKKQKAKEAAAGALGGSEVKNDGKWSIACEAERKWVLQL
ncbi:hypothetical protein IAT40_001988 [Kwoniella sp. CBS 6097]